MGIAALVEAIMARPGPTRLVAIDAPGGTGTSTFAAQLASAANGAPVIHTDDCASDDNPTDWWPRTLTQVIGPLARSDAAVYQRANGSPESIAESHTVEPAPIVIIEGVSAGRSEWSEHLSFIIWIETPRDERLRRGSNETDVNRSTIGGHREGVALRLLRNVGRVPA
jgi:uridine kinase